MFPGAIAAAMAAMIDGIHGIAALDQLTSERLVATAVLGEAVRHHDDSPRRDPGQPGLGIQVDTADACRRKFTMLHAIPIPVATWTRPGPRPQAVPYSVAGGKPAGTFLQA
mgnify:CR=1 FL=1